MISLVDVASWLLIVLGSFFTVVGALGLVRMPDIFTHMHAASVTDTLGVAFLIFGMCLAGWLYAGNFEVVLSSGAVLLHRSGHHPRLAQACLHEGVRPMLAEDRRGRKNTPSAGAGRRPWNSSSTPR